MANMKWDEGLSVGDLTMDEQHQLLFDYVNEFFELCRKQADKKTMLQVLDKVFIYTQFHFNEEEQLMAENNYPGLELHQSIHRSLIQSLNQFIRKVEQGEPVTMEVKHFLKQWLVSHIKCVDQDYAQYISNDQHALNFPNK